MVTAPLVCLLAGAGSPQQPDHLRAVTMLLYFPSVVLQDPVRSAHRYQFEWLAAPVVDSLVWATIVYQLWVAARRPWPNLRPSPAIPDPSALARWHQPPSPGG